MRREETVRQVVLGAQGIKSGSDIVTDKRLVGKNERKIYKETEKQRRGVDISHSKKRRWMRD